MTQQFPDKLIIEPTTRCNFKCEMCVKQSSGCDIAEGDLTHGLFDRCTDLLPHVSTVIFTGIGEPLLHQNLEKYLSMAKDRMPDGSIRGFQTNGKLLTPKRAVDLIRSGLNKICISVDSVQPALFDTVRKGGDLSDITMAFQALKTAKKSLPGHPLTMGIEFVLMKKNMGELTDLVDWAGANQVDFILVTHISAYDETAEGQIAWLNNSKEALELFEAYKNKALQTGLDIRRYEQIRFKVERTPEEDDIYRLVDAFKQEALEKDLYVNMFHLLSEPDGEFEQIQAIFDQAGENADRAGIELILPQIRPKTERYCPFVEDNAMFVTWDGRVSPCYFLWHRYTAMRAGYMKQVTPVYFGNVLETPARKIWHDPEYTAFREKVVKYDYPNCHAWCETRCDYVLDDPFYQDCYINDIPCCDCHWGLGLLNCLI